MFRKDKKNKNIKIHLIWTYTFFPPFPIVPIQFILSTFQVDWDRFWTPTSMPSAYIRIKTIPPLMETT